MTKKQKQPEECTLALWHCAYHACMSNHCQYGEVKKNGGALWVRRCKTPSKWHLELCTRCKWGSENNGGKSRCPAGNSPLYDYKAMECLCCVKFPEKYITLFPGELNYILL